MSSWIRGALRKVGRQILIRIGKTFVAGPIRRAIQRFETATEDPRAVQDALLERILQFHRDTGFGRDHQFHEIRTLEDFRHNVPIAGYDAIEPYVNRVAKGDINALVADKIVHMLALTSGTTSSRKLVPVTPQYLEDYKRGWNVWGLKVFRDHPKVKLRPVLQMASDWNEFQTEAGIPCGAVTGLTAKMQKKIIRFLYSVPFCVSQVKNALAKYYLVLRLSVPRHVGMLIAANPSTMLNLARLGNDHRESLIRDIFDGTLSDEFDVSKEIRQAVRRRLKASPSRARELEKIVEDTGHLYPKDYWHDFLLGNWTGGSVGAYLQNYPEYFGDAPVRDVGLIASEGRMTIPVSDNTPAGILDITSHFFEFIPEGEIDSPAPTVLRADEVEEGENYYILPTTAYGFYRYNIYDVVRVAGFHNKTPLIEFLSKGSHFSNVTGEKLSEYHVTKAMKEVLHLLDLKLSTYTLAPCWPSASNGNGQLPYYGLFIEQKDFQIPKQGELLVQELDSHLRDLNVEYDAKRESMRLDEVHLHLLPAGTWQEWDRQRLLKSGGTLEQYKHPCLIGDLDFHKSMPEAQDWDPAHLESSV